jgi:hypothetical protein
VALQVQNRDIMSQGEFAELCRHLDAADSSPTLSAWFDGMNVTPVQLKAAFDVDARLAAVDDRAHQILDLGTSRLVAAFPQLAVAA